MQRKRSSTARKSKKLKTVQEELERAAKKLFGKNISLIGSGRTDAGVHAAGQVANFKIDSKLPLDNIKKGLNRFLPEHISVVSAQETPLNFHARFDAKEKLYKYTIVNRKVRHPLLKEYAAFVSYDLDIDAMKKAGKFLIGRKDFRSFQSADRIKRASVRTVKMIDIIVRGPLVEIYIQADGFLYNMARNIVGTLIEVGRGRLRAGAVKNILLRQNRRFAGQTAPAKGLCLLKVFY
jgi:tRNA pseudouridine38-40 synthase